MVAAVVVARHVVAVPRVPAKLISRPIVAVIVVVDVQTEPAAGSDVEAELISLGRGRRREICDDEG
jgi:hypothetical protein